MDKTCIIILLLVIIVIAIFYKKDESSQPKNRSKYYQDISRGVTEVANDVSYGAKNTLNNLENGIHNTFDSIENRFDNKDKESFNNNFRNIQKKKLIYTNPNLVEIVARKGDNFLTVTDMNGIQEGNRIIINPKGRNRESNIVIGLGNNIVHLNRPLKNHHHPNEKVYNVDNENANPIASRFPDVGYGYIDQNTKDVGFDPEENTWAFDININDQQIKGWCGPDSQFLKNSKMPNCIDECKRHPQCSAVRWINNTNDCSLMKSCNKTNNDKRWRHMYMNQPTFKLGNPACNTGHQSLNEKECQQVANAQEMKFYKWDENTEWPTGCFQYKVNDKPAIAHNPSDNTTWPNSGNEATQYCK